MSRHDTLPNIDTLLERSREKFAAQDLTSAEELLRQAISVDSGCADAHHFLGIVLREQDRLTEAEPSMKKAVELQPRSAAYHSSMGYLLLRSRQFERAEPSLVEVVRLAPDRPEDWFTLGTVYMELGKFGAAKHAFEEACLRAPGNLDVLVKLSTAQFLVRELEASIRTAERAVELVPDHPVPHLRLGAALLSGGHPKRAEASAVQAIERGLQVGVAYLLLAESLASQERWREAADCYRQAISMNPESWEMRLEFGRTLSKDGDLQGAKDVYTQAATTVSTGSGIAFNVGYELLRHFPFDAVFSVEDAALRDTNITPFNIFNIGKVLPELEVATQLSQIAGPNDEGSQRLVTPDINPANLASNLTSLYRGLARLTEDDRFGVHKDKISRILEVSGNPPPSHVFVLSTGRCGTLSLCQLLSKFELVRPYHNFWWLVAP
jgi:tetratricopeptide (TPR) repeat protein